MSDRYNHEHYRDPTAQQGIEAAVRDEEAKAACEVLDIVNRIVRLFGYSLVGIRIRHRRTGREYPGGRRAKG